MTKAINPEGKNALQEQFAKLMQNTTLNLELNRKTMNIIKNVSSNLKSAIMLSSIQI